MCMCLGTIARHGMISKRFQKSLYIMDLAFVLTLPSSDRSKSAESPAEVENLRELVFFAGVFSRIVVPRRFKTAEKGICVCVRGRNVKCLSAPRVAEGRFRVSTAVETQLELT